MGKSAVTLVLISITMGIVSGDPKTKSSLPDDPVQHAWEEKRLENYLGYENCRKCHQQQVDKLITTQHFKSFETTHRFHKAKAFCRELGIRSIKRDARCIRCHYTPEESTRGIRAQSGISCESCHGPSKNWIKGHNNYGGLLVTKARESIDHRNFRIESSIKNGMRHPSNLYLLARSCYECHLVDDAELVNVTAHPPISNGFNMVAWSQGSMRHNFLRTDQKSNAKSSPQRLQVMFVVDLLAKLEATLKSISKSKPESNYYRFMNDQYITTAKKLLDISGKVSNQQINQVVEILKNTPPASEPEVNIKAARQIQNIAFEFGKNESAHQLDAIQAMLPGEDQYR